ncbi:PHD-finger [Onchocerca flexuosa]|uniref:[histone H3]-trimethyl-L-lysine(4) demethylase n=1 Tax=Onchocerca flexuosa TaxID=387005 RepID=A0A238BVZ9_9BILA|nr:PHD-finger [Onchocerca flexuosa]
MQKNYSKYYTEFERPPFAPTFYPTEEEFADPISYVAKIKPEAEKYGVIKVKPPPSFRPPFAIDSEKFNFTPRIQKLNQIDALIRARLIFDAQLASYWHMQGYTLEIPTVDNKYVDFYNLYKVVMETGGADTVSAQKRWSYITKKLGFKQQRTNKIKTLYFKWIDVFQKLINQSGDDEENKNDVCSSTTNDAESGQAEYGRRRIPQPRTKSMAGLRSHAKEKKTKTSDPMDEIVCKKCGKGDDEEHLLLCEDCDYALHTQCCSPALSSVPRFEWRCLRCSLASIKEIAESYAFHDAHTSYNLLTFAKYANDWKQNHFHRNPLEVPCEEVEQEYWKNVIDLENTVVVKYGADLAVSKVGSGFPMNGYDFGGKMDPKEREHYANHPWNLNNLPILKDSVLSHMETGISGMMVPWVYVGMCLSAFCWHTEDHWTYSVNYLHWGERKIWYGVSGDEGEKFDKVMMELVPYLFERQPDVLHHMTTTINPKILINKGIHVYTVHQEPGEFVITFPRSYHAGYNEGLNFAEAVNFAPADWLRKGRLCILEYARVHRNCVFSHEELMVKMAKCATKLSVNVGVAVHEELYEIIIREKHLREIITSKGITESARVEYEHIPDDFRSCAICKTTLFMSSLTCKHKKLVCLMHADLICSVCQTTNLTFNYRYTVQELNYMCDMLTYGICDYPTWRNKLLSVINTKNNDVKPTVEDLRILINVSKARHFPQCDATIEAMNIIKRSENIMQTARALMNRRIRTRNSLRKHANEHPADIKDIEKLEQSIEELPCTILNLEFNVKNYMKRIGDWRKRCSQFLMDAVDYTDKYDQYIDLVKKLIEEADDFNMLDKCHWLQCAHKILAWVPKYKSASKSGNQNTVELDQTKERWKLKELIELIEKGRSIAENDVKFQKEIDALNVMLNIGHQNECVAQTFLRDEKNEGIGMEEAEKLQATLEVSYWMTEEYTDKFRSEYKLARNVYDTAQRLKENENYTLKSLNDLLFKIGKSFILKNSIIHSDMERLHDCVQNFCRQICQMFVPSASYYNIVEILNGRDDLTELIEGVATPLILVDSLLFCDNWTYIENFESVEQLTHHVDSLYEQQRRLIITLRKLNEVHSIGEMCLCSGAKDMDNSFIRCLLCHAKFHSSCVQWNPFMSQLPVGYYLCVRCLRSRRPFAEDVKNLCGNAVPSLERMLVEIALKHAELAYKEALDAIGKLPPDGISLDSELCKRHVYVYNLCLFFSVDESLIAVFCNEILNSEAWKLIIDTLIRVKPPTEKDKEIYEQIKQRSVSAQVPSVLFPDSSSGKRRRGLKRGLSGYGKFIAGHRKRSKNHFHQEQDACSATTCLHPYSDQIRWIQCEAGCSRWYHYVCVGQTVNRVDQTSMYYCHSCLTEGKIPPACSSSGSPTSCSL